MKHHANSTASPSPVTIKDDILKWALPSNIDGNIRTSEQPIDPREGKPFTVSGRVWRVGLEGNDCDLHMELSEVTASNTSDRVIVEVPQEDETTRTKLLTLLPAKTRQSILNLNKHANQQYGAVGVSSGPKIQVTGLAFYDATHYSPNWQTNKPGHCNYNAAQRHKRGNSHGSCAVGTLWELHPVWIVAAAP